MQIKKSTIILLTIGFVLIVLGAPLLGGDSGVFLKWWLMALAMGIGFMPLSIKIFSYFSDGGWIFSKVLGIFLSGYLCWLIVTGGFVGFDTSIVVICTLILILLIWTLYIVSLKRKKENPVRDLLQKQVKSINWQLVILEEVLFIGMFLLWTYIAGFTPAAHGTEKFMDFGYMAAMMRDSALPAQDMWFAGEPINYYYGGQYYAVFLTRLTGCDVAQTYNVMRTFIASFAFVMPFGLVWQLVADRKGKVRKGLNKIAVIGGVIAGAAVSLAGNMHYVIYKLFGEVFKPTGYENYWLSTSTRFIGHNPQTADECIHEYPSYSFLLGDLHAHLVNIIFVLLFIAILYCMIRENDRKRKMQVGWSSSAKMVVSVVLDKYLWLLGMLIGVFHFTNHWDFIIYLTVAAFAFLILVFRGNEKKKLPLLGWILRCVVLFLIGEAFALPFTLTFKSMFMGVGLVQEHSAFYQLMILWGLPIAAVVILLIWVILHTKKSGNMKPFTRFITNMSATDMFVLILGICAVGLVLMPELVYVIDIYGDGTSRANTMFKLTYQAFIMFGIVFGYMIVRLAADSKKIIWRILSSVILALLFLTCIYFPYGISVWSGDITNRDGYKGLDATTFLEAEFAEDAEAIRWIEDNIEGKAVVLEAAGDSYTDNCRVSAMTGVATPLGWYVHEWLWRNDPVLCRARWDDVYKIYMTAGEEEARELIEKYGIEYIFVGSQERQMCGTGLNEPLLYSLGEVVFKGTVGQNPAYIIKVE